MPSLMDLPLEVCTMIFKEVINGHRTPPSWLGHIGNTRYDDQQADQALKYKTRPKWPLCLLKTWLKSTFSMGYATEEYGGIIYERTGTIFMMVNGRLETSLDLADGLAKLLVQSPPETMDQVYWGVDVGEFQMWKETTILERQAP
ncbi:hypothetical protein N7537_007091 [Penicillium hordei]|uniref:Uncharacterized protein n=1 Tax=Penicillium hordei TaxID=40994 RepID=A0AAD6H505_9EURO|nr:uncharacterized protein N7537_007091 [Penicillium hordei]KAJ5604135.1 hypothetical protein N7537_007091 [Penicillium hordei]